jgi:hypothetical protein
MPSEIDPYYMFLGISPKERPIDLYRLLGVDQLESSNEIISMAADRQMGHLQRYESGEHSDQVAKLMSEVSRARLCLLDPEKKAAYDKKIRAKQRPDLPTKSASVTTSMQLAPLEKQLPSDTGQSTVPSKPQPEAEPPVEFRCEGCGVQLRARRKDEGKQIRCPKCSVMSTVPIDAEILPASETMQPLLPNQLPPSFSNPTVPVAANPYLPPVPTPASAPYVAKQRTLRPHRGGTILTFGLLGLFCCGIFAISAWVMANTDLQMMDRGVMDPAGRSSTQAGKVLGIVTVCIYVVYFGFVFIGVAST